MLAALQHLGSQIAALPAKDIGGGFGVSEGRQLYSVLGQLDTDELAPARQCDVVDALPIVIWHAFKRLGRVGAVDFSHASVRAYRKHKACAKGMRRPHERAHIARLGHALDSNAEIASHPIAFEPPSLKGGDHKRTVGVDKAAFHTLCVERRGDASQTVDRDHAALTA